MRKLTSSQGEDYTTGCLLYYFYIKSQYILVATDLSRQEKLDVCSIKNQQTEVVVQLKTVKGVNAGVTQSMFVLTILEKLKETGLKFSQGSVMDI